MNYNIKNKTQGNPVDTTNKTGADEKRDYSQFEPSFYNQDEREKMLMGYDAVPREAFELLKPGTHIRYLTTKGEFRRGGFVHNVKTKGDKMIFVETSRKPTDPKYAKWPVAFDSIDTLWKKRTLEDVRINEVSKHSDFEDRLHNVELSVEQVSNELKRLIQTVAKLTMKLQPQPQSMAATLRPPSNNGAIV